MTSEFWERAQPHEFTVVSVEEWGDQDLVAINVLEGDPVVVLLDDFVTMMIELSRDLGLPLSEIKLAGLTLSLDERGLPRLAA